MQVLQEYYCILCCCTTCYHYTIKFILNICIFIFVFFIAVFFFKLWPFFIMQVLHFGFRTTLMKGFDPLQMMTGVYYFLLFSVYWAFSSIYVFISQNYFIISLNHFIISLHYCYYLLLFLLYTFYFMFLVFIFLNSINIFTPSIIFEFQSRSTLSKCKLSKPSAFEMISWPFRLYSWASHICPWVTELSQTSSGIHDHRCIHPIK